MAAEVWRAAPGFADHEVSDRGRVRTTAAGSSSSTFPWGLLLLLAVVAVVIYKAQLVNQLATAVTLALCAIPVAWVVRQGVGELLLNAEVRRYRTPASTPHRQPLALPRAPLAIEAARPVVIDVAFEDVTRRIAG